MKKRRIRRIALLFCPLMLMGTTPQVLAESTATVTITADVVASCSLSAPAAVDMGSIPYSAFEGLSSWEEIQGYDKTFTLVTTCSGSDKFKLSFAPSSGMYNGCVGNTDRAITFCFYGPDGSKLDMNNTERLATLEMDVSTTEVNIRTVVARGSALSVGTHSGVATITLEPL